LDSFAWVMIHLHSPLDSAVGLAVMIPRMSDCGGAKLCSLVMSIVASLGCP